MSHLVAVQGLRSISASFCTILGAVCHILEGSAELGSVAARVHHGQIVSRGDLSTKATIPEDLLTD